MAEGETRDRSVDTPSFEPMSFGMILDRAIQLYLRNFGLLIGVTVVPQLAASLLSFAGGSVLSRSQSARAWLTFLLITLASTVLTSLSTGAVTVAVSGRYLGREVAIGSCYRAVVRKLARILGARLLAGLLVGVGLLLLVVPGIFWAVAFSLVVPVIMLEGRPEMRVLKRSRLLTKGFRWQILGLFVLYLLVVYGLVFLGIVLAGITGGGPPGMYGSAPIARLVNLLSGVFLGPFAGILTVLIYYNQRIRKEGYDLQLLAEALAEG